MKLEHILINDGEFSYYPWKVEQVRILAIKTLGLRWCLLLFWMLTSCSSQKGNSPPADAFKKFQQAAARDDKSALLPLLSREAANHAVRSWVSGDFKSAWRDWKVVSQQLLNQETAVLTIRRHNKSWEGHGWTEEKKCKMVWQDQTWKFDVGTDTPEIFNSASFTNPGSYYSNLKSQK